MFGKLKEAAGGAAVQKVVDAISPQLMEHTDKLTALKPESVRCDDTYTETFVQPALLAVSAASSGVTKLIPRFEERFSAALLHLRDELLDLGGERVALVEGFQERLPEVMLSGLKKA
ncbi:hypothetical protein [Alkalilimnicola sp. S0819]|uniref:hypothetical protein n=1 Tax=Alkalilimnicola sp. S0819 TaxID=2613922 RepID=UPI00126237FC|nr:hypothetical protein [Alkalilimnicola sp. S0819]KAB7628459.1 hypothetical protein F3N43_01830 [Alkalilimnicola sp. S0819]MPQ15366.1 hypothetical protein [Alkalilimnicola sp. S0819]